MERSIIIAGSGGQGILFLGKMIAYATMHEGKKVTWFPSYGAEMRGGTANCTVIISDEMIGSPVVIKPEILIAMNGSSLDRFLPTLRKRGMLFYDSSLITKPVGRRDILQIPVPATGIAGETGSPKLANMVMLGACIARTGILHEASIFSIFTDAHDRRKAESLKDNIGLVQKGIDYIAHT